MREPTFYELADELAGQLEKLEQRYGRELMLYDFFYPVGSYAERMARLHSQVDDTLNAFRIAFVTVANEQTEPTVENMIAVLTETRRLLPWHERLWLNLSIWWEGRRRG